jgi:hypothetical protein
MAQYKYGAFLQHGDSAAYDQLHAPGATAPDAGIYRCVGCGREIVSHKNYTLPPQNHHQHAPGQGLIRWQLLVYAQYW